MKRHICMCTHKPYVRQTSNALQAYISRSIEYLLVMLAEDIHSFFQDLSDLGRNDGSERWGR